MSYLGYGRDSRSFEVVIYEEDYKELCAWVLKKPSIETGGDLFGLWADKYTAVIQLVLGPGQDCRRSSVSFYQDIDYLERVGSYLTQNEGVCHIGEWHSHHQLGLARPSGGDENTVWNNMPTYNLKRFVIFIANIQKSSKLNYNVDIGCFLFEIDDKGRQQRVLPGKFTIMQKALNPFSRKKELSEKRKHGAEEDECKIAIEDVKLEVKKGGKSPTVTYTKKIPAAPNKKRDRMGNNPPQDKANDGESSGATTSKKKKVKNDGSVHNTGDGISESGNKSPVSPGEELEKLKIDDDNDAEQQENKKPEDNQQQQDDDEPDDEQDEQQQQQQQENEEHQPEDNQQQQDDDGPDDEQDEQQQQQQQQQEQENEEHQPEEEQQQQQDKPQQQQQQQQDESKGEENEEGTAQFGEVNKEAGPRRGEEGKPEKKSDTKESARAAPRPLPKLEKEKAPATTTGKKSDTKKSADPPPRPLPQLGKEKTPATTTGKKTLQVVVTAKKTTEQSYGKKAGKKGKQQK
ncbi:hypothetical protein OS493_026259 [Desmophyllum pertusum]|uniref:Uncharacterized protein n=1 Tax=Desmophyllum pertusum TaxID=174260 RepID=A0A9X0D2X1_9CNID|nr:hypothetical protein OS493_026259 [Desmophyllum pertusum]